jgi:RNA polymerase sigma-70 factor (ECF subfamily)
MSDAVRRFNALIEPHLDALFRAAYRLARNRADAEDLVQEACVRAFGRIFQLNDAEPVAGWLLRVLHNVFVDGVRHARRSPIVDGGGTLVDASASPEPNPEDVVCRTQREEQLHGAWLKLERGQRALLALRAEGYSLTEIAMITGLDMDVLNARLYRARQSFARHLKDEPVLPRLRLEIAK